MQLSLRATDPQHFSTPHMELLKLLCSIWNHEVRRCVVMHTASNLMDKAVNYIRSHNVSHKYLQLTAYI